MQERDFPLITRAGPMGNYMIGVENIRNRYYSKRTSIVKYEATDNRING